MKRIQCSRCKEIIRGKNEADLSMKFDTHVCRNMRDIKQLPDELLLKVIKKEITEEQAWAEFDKK